MIKKKIASDIFLNIASAGIPLVVLQLGMMPCLAGKVSETDYGLIVTLIALIGLCPQTVGNVLNNVRLLDVAEEANGIKRKNYAYLCLLFSILAAIVTGIVSALFIGRFNNVCIGMVLVSILVVYREFFVVEFRIRLNFKKILYSNLFLVLGYVVGFVLFLVTSWWVWIYLVGYSLSLLYILSATEIWRSPFAKDGHFVPRVKEAWTLLFASALGRMPSYADRIVLFPLLGGTSVSVYYVATLFGKVLSMLVSPVNSVLLSYLTKLDKKPMRAFAESIAAVSALSIVGYAVTLAIAEPCLAFLYPQFVGEAMPYVGVVTATAYVGAIVTVIDPYILRFLPLRWQIVEYGGYSVLYFFLSLALMAPYGLLGFCIGGLAASIVRLVVMLILFVVAKPKVTQ